MSAYGLGKLVGITVGILVGILFIILFLKISKNDGGMKCKYDERQLVARGQGYRLGFFVLLIGNALYMMLEAAEVQLPVDHVMGLCIIMFTAILANVTYCIFKDAYFSLNENKNRLLWIFLAISIINMVFGVSNICSGEAITNGVLNYNAINLICGLLFIGIFVALFVKKIVSKNEE